MRYTLPERKTRIFQCVIPLRWGDMDAMGHLNNASYFRLLETCRIDWFVSLGIPVVAPREGAVIVNAFCNFYRQLTYPGSVLVTMYASDPARTTFETWATMERTDEPGVVYAEGGATTIWVDFSTQKSAPLPDWLRAAVSA